MIFNCSKTTRERVLPVVADQKCEVGFHDSIPLILACTDDLSESKKTERADRQYSVMCLLYKLTPNTPSQPSILSLRGSLVTRPLAQTPFVLLLLAVFL